MPNARKRVRAFLAAAAEKYPDTPNIATVRDAAGSTLETLTTADLQALLRSERAARHHNKTQREVIRTQDGQLRNLPTPEQLKDQRDAANVQIQDLCNQLLALPTPEQWRDTQAENARLRESIRTLREQLCSLREDPGTTDFLTLYETVRAEAVRLQDRNRVQAETIEQLNRAKTAAEKDAISVPALRALVERRSREIKELKVELDRARAGKPPLHPEEQTDPVTGASWKRLAEIRQSDLRRICAERDRLQEAVNNLRRAADTPPRKESKTYADILTAEDLRKAAEDLLPQFLAVFLRSGK